MPWQEVKPMDQRICFIADYLRGGSANVSELCRLYGISRKTGYKWMDRYQSTGIDGLQEQSRRPHGHPDAIPYSLKCRIIELRQRFQVAPGPKKILALLAAEYPNTALPSLTSIHNVLSAAGLIHKRRKRNRVPVYTDKFRPVVAPNQLWSVDFKGQFKLGNGQWCYPLTVMDHQSRYLIGCRGFCSANGADTRRAFEKLFREYGLPDRIRSDNGVPFASRAAGGLSELSAWWVKLGIRPERIEPGKPQQNGQHERIHRTLKRAVTRPAAYSMAAQQRKLTAFKREYNDLRPHEALGQKTPASAYQPSNREYPGKLEDMHYPEHLLTLKVRPSGVVYWSGGQVYVSHILKDELIGMEEVDDGIWELYYGPVRLGGFDQRHTTDRATDYWTLKCNPCI